MPLLRRMSLIAFATLLALPVFAPSPAAAARDYESVVAITFPTVASARYRDDYLAGRGSRAHRATDVFAPAGSPVYAARGGKVVWFPPYEHASAGFAIQIQGDDGRTYAYYHLGPAGGRRSQAVSDGVVIGGRVERGQRIGFVGDSGNAAGGSPHLHFEIHDPDIFDPWGGSRVNPYASLRAAQGSDAPTAGAAAAEGALQLGARGPQVEQWQRDLNRSGSVAQVAVDGAFGPLTHQATVAFQRQVGLGPDGLGVVGPRTRAAMERVLRNPDTAAVSRSRPDALLRIGDRGPAVVTWQRDLNRVGRFGLATDGVFGPLTRAATATFQRRARIAADGIVGPQSRAAMARALATR